MDCVPLSLHIAARQCQLKVQVLPFTSKNFRTVLAEAKHEYAMASLLRGMPQITQMGLCDVRHTVADTKTGIMDHLRSGAGNPSPHRGGCRGGAILLFSQYGSLGTYLL